MNNENKVIISDYKCPSCSNNIEFSCIYRDITDCNYKFNIIKCDRCGLAATYPQPNVEQLSEVFYGKKYYSYNEHTNENSSRSLLTSFIKAIRNITWQTHYCPESRWRSYSFVKRCLLRTVSFIGRLRYGVKPPLLNGGSILDVGCGDGLFLHSMKNIGWEVFGVEIDIDAAARAQKSGLQNVYHGTFDSIDLPDQSFDCIRFWSVLEHLHDPIYNLNKAKKLLKPSGLLVLQTPNFSSFSKKITGISWNGLDAPRHLYHYRPEDLVSLLDKCGFECCFWKTSSVGTLSVSFSNPPNPILRFCGIALDVFFDFFKRGDCMVFFASPRP